MARPDPQETADSTWQSPPIRRWRIKFFVSLCLFGFMAGLMLGALFKEERTRSARLLHVQALDAGMRLCFSRLPRAAVLEESGAFVMLFAVEPADEQQGVLSLSSGGLASWHLSERSDGMQLGFVSLQPLRGSWSKDSDGSSCIRVDIFMAP